MSEEQVGIIEYWSQGQSLKGILKHRITDFIVEEIDIQKNIATHNNKYKEELLNFQNEIIDIVRDKQIIEELKKYLDIEELNTIQLYIDDPKNYIENHKNTRFQIPVSKLDKNERGSIHQLVRQYIPQFESKTITVDGLNFIELFYQPKKRSQQNFLQFNLRKQNQDTMNALNILSKALNKKSGNFFFCGTKDKRGDTVQKVVAKGLGKKELANKLLNEKNWKFSNIFVSNIKEVKECTNLGDLYGNRFSLAIRFPFKQEIQKIEQNLENLKNFGFINYFGEQRFGTKNVRTSQTGKLLLNKQYKEAFFSVLEADKTDQEKNKILEEFKEDENVKKTIQKLHRRYIMEKKLLGSYNQKNNYLECFMGLPKVMRNLYMHAYQSYLWNMTVSQRIQNYGKEIQIGDYVKEDEDIILITNEKQKQQYNIYDVVIPIIGTNINMDEKSLVNIIYKEIFEKEQISMNNFKNHNQSFLLNGDYRKMIEKIENLQWSIKSFNEWNEDVLSLDSDNDLFVIKDEGQYQYVVLQFILKKSCYATMVVREFFKNPVSFDLQMKLMDQMKEFNNDNKMLKQINFY